MNSSARFTMAVALFVAAISAIVFGAGASPATAQSVTSPDKLWFQARGVGGSLEIEEPPQESSVPWPRAAGAGLLGSTIGFVGGGYLGYALDRELSSDFECDCTEGLVGTLFGAFLGPIVVTPAVTHVLSGRRGEIGQMYKVAAIVGIAGFAGTLVTYNSPLGPVFFIGTPIAQVIAAAVIERK